MGFGDICTIQRLGNQETHEPSSQLPQHLCIVSAAHVSSPLLAGRDCFLRIIVLFSLVLSAIKHSICSSSLSVYIKIASTESGSC